MVAWQTMSTTPYQSQKLAFTSLDPATAEKRAGDFLSLMKMRRTVRDFSDQPVPRSLIETCVETAGSAPSGANQQPWHFTCISDSVTKQRIRIAAEAEERRFYAGRAGEEWLEALAPLGTDDQKPFLEQAPWLIAIFAQRWGVDQTGAKTKHYYVPESVGIATGMLIAALHNAGLATLTHTPAPMNFLREICGRPENEKPMILLVVGYPAKNAEVPIIDKKSANEITNFI